MKPVYQHLEQRLLLYGLEVLDYGVLLFVFFLARLFGLPVSVMVGLIGLAALGIRRFKVGRAPGYFLHVMRFVGRPGETHVRLDDSLPRYTVPK